MAIVYVYFGHDVCSVLQAKHPEIACWKGRLETRVGKLIAEAFSRKSVVTTGVS